MVYQYENWLYFVVILRVYGDQVETYCICDKWTIDRNWLYEENEINDTGVKHIYDSKIFDKLFHKTNYTEEMIKLLYG